MALHDGTELGLQTITLQGVEIEEVVWADVDEVASGGKYTVDPVSNSIWLLFANGNFANINTFGGFHVSGTNIFKVLRNNAADITNSNAYIGADDKVGASLRLFRNSPVGADRRTITATSTANISSTALQVAIPFGYMVEAIRITNLQPATNLTSVSATHNNTSGASLGTLITGKTVNAATSQIFPATLLDMASQVTDGTVRLIATGNGANGLRIDVILRKTMTI
jgi:hypothetical protein